MFRWLRNYTRSKTLFMDPHYAAQIKNRLALAYAFIAWNAFGFVIYFLYKEKVPKTYDSVDYAKVYGITNAKVVRFEGMNKLGEYDIKLSEEELEEHRGVIGTKEEKKLYEEKIEAMRRAKEAEQKLTNT